MNFSFTLKKLKFKFCSLRLFLQPKLPPMIFDWVIWSPVINLSREALKLRIVGRIYALHWFKWLFWYENELNLRKSCRLWFAAYDFLQPMIFFCSLKFLIRFGRPPVTNMGRGALRLCLMGNDYALRRFIGLFCGETE